MADEDQSSSVNAEKNLGDESADRKTEQGWQSIETAPKDGTRFKAKLLSPDLVNGNRRRHTRVTWWGKASHVPLYGWCYGRDPENVSLWEPTRWRPIITRSTRG